MSDDVDVDTALSYSADDSYEIPDLPLQKCNGNSSGSDSDMSDSCSDASGDEDDDLRQFISLNLGQALTSFILPYSGNKQNHCSGLESNENGSFNGELSKGYTNASPRQRSFSQTTSASSYGFCVDTGDQIAPHTICGNRWNGLTKLDNIQLNNNYEYGFNPGRDYDNRRKLSCKPRPVSLYVDPVSSLFSSNGILTNTEQCTFDSSSITHSKKDRLTNTRWISLAKTDSETHLEEELHSLRRRPSKLMFHPSSPARNSRKRYSSRIRSGLHRRQLSFDSQLTQRATLSLDSNSPRGSESPEEEDSLASIQQSSPCQQIRSQNSFIKSKADLKLDLNFDITGDHTFARISPRPQRVTEKVVDDRLVGGTDERDTSPEKGKQQGFHDLINAFKLPYKRTVGKLRRKSHEEKIKSKRAVWYNDDDNNRYTSHNKSAPATPECSKVFEAYLPHASSTNIISSSSCSLPRVDEGKETFSFDSRLTRKACSSCSIAYGKQGSPIHNRNQRERRLSDGALHTEKTIGCSPKKTLVRRLLSPVVCGGSTEKYSLFGMMSSSHSLNSDCSSLHSDEDYQPSCLLADFSLTDIAEHLCLIDKELIIRIPWKELVNCGWMSKNKYACSPNVMNNVEFFNRVAMLVTSCILDEENALQRAKLISKAIKLGKKCRNLKNFNSLRAILGGLQCTPIYRLKNTWKHVKSRTKRLFKELSTLMDNENNFALYRRELKESLAEPPCLPFLGDFFTQIAHASAYSSAKERYEMKYEARTLNSAANRRHGMTSGSELDNVNGHAEKDAETSYPTLNSAANRRHGMTSGSELDNVNGHAEKDAETSYPTLNSAANRRHGMTSGSELDNVDGQSARDAEITYQTDKFQSNSLKRHTRNYSDDSGVIVLKSACETPENDDMEMSDASPSSPTQKDINKSAKRKSFKGFDNNGFSIAGFGSLQAKEYQFWRYQITAIQYRFPLKHDVHSFLVNSPIRSEEDNYRISLAREKPAKDQTRL